MPPKVIGRYRVLETLGTGGVGTVYRAVDRRTGEAAALKLLSTGPALDPRAARRLAREFETLYELSHPNVVKVFDTGVFHGYPYLAMELVEGLNLRQYLSLTSEELATGGARTPRSVEVPRDEEPGSRDGSVDRIGEDTARELARRLGEGGGERPFNLEQFAQEPPSEEVDL